MPTSTVEQYVKTLYSIYRGQSGSVVQMKELAERMGVSPGTATAMVKHLSQLGLLEYYPRKGTALTDVGQQLALRMLRRHRLIETFLERFLGYDWSEVHRDAEELEHVVSDRFVERIDALLGYPAVDPHGDPIPTEEGSIETATMLPLDQVEENHEFEIARITRDDSDFLTLLKERGLVPGERFVLTEKNRTAGTITVRAKHQDNECTLGYELGGKILVK